MIIRSEFEILTKCRYWLERFGLNANSKVSAYGAISVPNWLIYVIYSIPMAISVVLSAWHIVDNNFDLTVSSVAIIIIFGGGQVQLIYLLMAVKRDLIFGIIHQLQSLVNKR